MASLPDHPGFDSTGTIRKCLAGEKWGVESWGAANSKHKKRGANAPLLNYLQLVSNR